MSPPPIKVKQVGSNIYTTMFNGTKVVLQSFYMTGLKFFCSDFKLIKYNSFW